jgi:hypothetical protein
MSFGGRGGWGKGDYPFARVKPVSGLISPPQEYLPLTEKVSLHHLSYYRIIPNTLTFLDLTGPTRQPCSLQYTHSAHSITIFCLRKTFNSSVRTVSYTYNAFKMILIKKHVSSPESSVVNQAGFVCFWVSRIRIR